LSYRVKEWDVDFREYINHLKTKKHVVWCGDLNVCHQKIDIACPNKKLAGYTDEERESFTKTLS
jgi:exonuclease III